MTHHYTEPRIYGPPPMRCFCCGSVFRTTGCVHGFSCQCDPLQQCWHCHKCSKHCQCEAAAPRKASDFEFIYNPDGTCTYWDCGKPGVVLAYDSFSPEGAHWFCEAHWSDEVMQTIMEIIEDRRQKTGGQR